MKNQLDAVEQCVLQIVEILFSSLAQSKGIFRKPNLLPLPERALLVMRMLGYTKKKKKEKYSKPGPNISKGEQTALQVVFTD